MKIRKEVLFIFILFSLSLAFAITGYAVQGDVSSSVSIEGLRILYTTFNGSTTNFGDYNITTLNNLSNMTLEKTSYGKVNFNENVNLTLTAGDDKIVDFDSYFDISSNLVYANPAYLPWLNKTVTISLYGLSYTNPQIMKQGVVCTDCTELSYSGGILIFNTTTFKGSYYARETPTGPTCGNGVCETGETSSSCPADCETTGGGGGGGGGATGETTPTPSEEGYDFYVDPGFFTYQMYKGDYFQKFVRVINNGTKDQEIFIGVSGVNQFVFPQEESFNLPAGQNRTVRLNIYVSDKRASDVYVGKVIFRSEKMERSTKIILDVKSRSALFDIRTNVLKKYINPGGRARANVTIVNFGSLRNFDVSLNYMIVDFDNNNYTIKKEDFAMNQTYHNIFYLEVPKDLPVGNYLFYSRVNYGDVSATSYDTFTIENISFIIWIIVVAIILIIIIILIIRIRDKQKKEKPKGPPKIIKKPLIRKKVMVPRISDI